MVLAVKSGSFKFTIAKGDDSSTFILISEEEANKQGLNQIDVNIVTLNEFIYESKIYPIPDIIKIDAEGLDLEVLKGPAILWSNRNIHG